ncbi:hypothetical protein VNO78_20295 [Psophocarpus tetragonolobus]|uniref:WRKY domain-containing protein n=1 Tax=Psophocarpus tetragonolobus TaxID=3891 RepID=A0AAN9SEB2_PSOTE
MKNCLTSIVDTDTLWREKANERESRKKYVVRSIPLSLWIPNAISLLTLNTYGLGSTDRLLLGRLVLNGALVMMMLMDGIISDPRMESLSTKLTFVDLQDINVSADNNCLAVMEECQSLARAVNMPLAPPTQDSEQVHSFNDAEKEKFPFDLNAALEEEEEPFSNETNKPPESASADNIRPLPSNDSDVTLDVPADNDYEDRGSAVKGGSASRNRKRQSSVEKYDEKGGLRGEISVAVQIESEQERIVCDGYRWRKYGQKTIIGHLFPRSRDIWITLEGEFCQYPKLCRTSDLHKSSYCQEIYEAQLFWKSINNIHIASSSTTPHMHYSLLNNANPTPYRSYGLNPSPQPGASMFPSFSRGRFQDRVNGDYASSSVFPFGATDARDRL